MMLMFKVFFLQCFLCVTVSGFSCYISPVAVVNESCTVSDNTTLRPCYMLQQLSSTYCDVYNMEIIFLPGIHIINQSLVLSDIKELSVYPWDGQHVVIECQLNTSWTLKESIKDLRIASLHFKYCHLASSMPLFAVIDNCVFSESKHTHAITFKGYYNISSSISICNCTFSSNNGGIHYEGSNIRSFHINITDSVFASNGEGGAISISTHFGNLRVERSQFINNTVTGYGGAIFSRSTRTQIMIISSAFQSNSARSGGAIYAGTLEIYDSKFKNNSARTSGGAILADIYNFEYVSLTIESTKFENNHCNGGGGAILFSVQPSEDIFEIQGCIFKNNSAQKGGAIQLIIVNHGRFVQYSLFTLIENNIFQENRANYFGGAIYVLSADDTSYFGSYTGIESCIFSRNVAELSGGALFFANLEDHTMTLNFLNSSFKYNQAGDKGGAIVWSCVTLDCHTRIDSGFDAIGNSAQNGGAMYVDGVDIRYIIDNATIKFTENIAESKGGALFIQNSHINVWKTQLTIIFAQNAVTSVDGKGGAIYVEYNCSVDACFVYIQKIDTVFFEFVNNSAKHGPVLYGGSFYRCRLYAFDHHHELLGINYFKNVSTYEQTPLAISSDPVRICLCNNDSRIDCSTREINTTKMKGETIKLTAISIDQDDNPGWSVIRAFYVEPVAELDVGESRKTVDRVCTNLSYHIFTVESSATLVLQLLDNLCEDSTESMITVHIKLTPCSRGFELINDRCTCDRRLEQYFDICNIDTRSVQRKGPTWLRYDQHHLKLSTNCPLDYCQVSSPTISLLSPDQQCANHRSGVLCGACKDNYSITLGASKCSRCTSSYSAIGWTVLFALAGLALVTLLLVCNMTISFGTLNGLIFYANVVSISGLTSLHNCSLCPILRVFLAWLNLDWGLQTCFYSGMDTYHKTWLQLAFPLYIWCLVTAIILASHYSSTAMRVFGTNNIAILATLFILSYTKILKTITTALSVTQVLQSHLNNTTHQLIPYRVWTDDGNVEYLKGKHVALFAVALFFLLFLFLPYTLLLIFGQCVRSMSVKRCLWVSRCVRSTAFVSIMDAYHAPYNKRHRYWTGLLLLTRCLLFLAFASSYGNTDPLLKNMCITTIITLGVLIYKLFVTRIYKHVFTNVLEICFLINLEILSATLTFLKGSNSSSEVLCRSSNASISISFILFLLILTYHTYLQLQKRRWFVQLKEAALAKWPLRYYHRTAAEEDSHVLTDPNIALPTTTLVELREELLASEYHKN